METGFLVGRRRLIPFASTMLLALGAALAPAASAADFEWNAPQELSRGNQAAEAPQVAIANDGSAVAVWRQNDGCRERLWAAYRNRGENFDVNDTKPPVVISSIPQEDIASPGTCNSRRISTVGRFDLAMNARGDAIVVMEKGSNNSGQTIIRSLYKPAGGRFDRNLEQTAAVGANGISLVEPKVSIDGTGTATVISHGPPQQFNDGVQFNNNSIYSSRVRGPGPASTWGSDNDLLPHSFGNAEFPTKHNETSGTIATNEAGDRLAALATQRREQDGTVQRQTVHAVQRNAGASSWTDLGPADYPAHGLDLPADGMTTAVRAGAVMLSWREAGRIYGSHEAGPELLVNNSLFAPPSQPSFDLDASGNALGLWTEAGPTAGGIYGAYSARGGAPGFEPMDLSPVPGNNANRPRTDVRLSTGRSDTAAAVFEETCGQSPPPASACPAGAASNDQVIRAAIRPPGAKTKFDAPATISPAGPLEPTTAEDPVTGPKIAINANGEGVAVWSQIGGVSGTDQIVRVALLTPTKPTASGETIPLPPPPPPPPPPLPTSIEVARKVGRGDAVVLTANVSGPVTSLQWSFGTKGEPKIVSTAGANGRVPLSVRLRHPSRNFTARLTAFGPGGTRSFSRTLVTPGSPDTSEARKVDSALNKTDAAGVFATGDAAGLLSTASAARASRRARGPKSKASASCSPISIYSGKQKVAGCFKPVEKLADIPAREKGAVKQLADGLKLDETKPEQMEAATKLTDSYVSEGKALLNDKFPVTPSQASSLVSMPQADTLFSANADLPVGGASYSPKNGFNLKLDPNKATIPLGKLPKPPKLPSLAGLEIVGDWDVNLDKQEAKIKASVKLPPSITKAGVQISNRVNLTATPDRVIVDEVRVGPVDVDIKALKVDKFQIQYKREPNQWDGQGKACLIGTACLDMIPPNGGVTIKNGDLERAGASLIFPQPGLPLWTGVNLERVGFGLGLRPTRVFGNARVGVAQFIKLDGRIFVALPTSAEPFVMNRNEVGNDYPPHLYGSKFTRFTFGASAAALVDVPVIGETKLGSAYVVYEYPGYFAFGGGYDATVLDLVRIRGGIAAEGDADQGVFDIHGEIEACLYLADLDLCSGATGHVSRGRGGTGGGGACVKYLGLSVGGGVRWNDISDPYIWPIDGCRWSPFRIQVRQSAAAARRKGKGPKASATRLVRGKASRAVLARESKVGVSQAGTYTIKVEKDKPSPVLRLDGIGTAPAIRVSGPGGVLEAPAGKGFVKTPDNKMRIMRYQGKLAKITSIGFQKADPGTYTVQVLPGSSPVVAVRQATDPPPAKVKGKVTGKSTGRNRVFSYEVARRPSQKVVFSEVTASGAAQVIGSTAGGKGKIRFRSAPGSGRRTILAQFSLDGINAERKRVTTFKPQSPVMARPKGIKLSRKGARVRVSWKRVTGATAYEVAVTGASRRMVFARTRGRRATLKVPAWDKGRVTVRAIDDLRQSPVAGRRFKAVAKRPSAFRSFPRCKVSKKKINCGKSKAKKKKAKKKRSRSKR